MARAARIGNVNRRRARAVPATDRRPARWPRVRIRLRTPPAKAPSDRLTMADQQRPAMLSSIRRAAVLISPTRTTSHQERRHQHLLPCSSRTRTAARPTSRTAEKRRRRAPRPSLPPSNTRQTSCRIRTRGRARAANSRGRISRRRSGKAPMPRTSRPPPVRRLGATPAAALSATARARRVGVMQGRRMTSPALTTTALRTTSTRWSGSRSRTRSLRRKLPSLLAFWSGTAPSNWPLTPISCDRTTRSSGS